MTGRMVALRRSCAHGRPSASANTRLAGAAHLCPWSLQPGEAFQFDWSEDWAVLGGERTKLQVAHTKLSHSRAFIVRAYLMQTHEMLFDALTQAFRVLGGVPRRGILR